MKTQKLAQTAKRMALLTLALMAAMLLLNTAYWLWPNLTINRWRLWFWLWPNRSPGAVTGH